MCSPNQLLLLAVAALLYEPYSEAAGISPPQRPIVKAKAAVTAIPAIVATLENRTLNLRLPRHEADLFRTEPNVAVDRKPYRFVSAAFNIRGLKDVRAKRSSSTQTIQ